MEIKYDNSRIFGVIIARDKSLNETHRSTSQGPEYGSAGDFLWVPLQKQSLGWLHLLVK